MLLGMTKPYSLSSVDNRYDGSLLTDAPQYSSVNKEEEREQYIFKI